MRLYLVHWCAYDTRGNCIEADSISRILDLAFYSERESTLCRGLIRSEGHTDAKAKRNSAIHVLGFNVSRPAKSRATPLAASKMATGIAPVFWRRGKESLVRESLQ
jgi:hypothetical protein